MEDRVQKKPIRPILFKNFGLGSPFQKLNRSETVFHRKFHQQNVINNFTKILDAASSYRFFSTSKNEMQLEK